MMADQQVEPGGPEKLVLKAAVSDLAEPAEIDGAGQRVARFARLSFSCWRWECIGGSLLPKISSVMARSAVLANLQARGSGPLGVKSGHDVSYPTRHASFG